MTERISTRICRRLLSIGLMALVSWNATSAAGEQRLGVLKANRILFLGNSLTLHGPREEIGWKHNWGMAASAPERDFVHRLTESLRIRAGLKLAIAPATGPGAAEPANVLNIAGILEREYRSYDAAKIRTQLDYQPDLVVLQFGENVVPAEFDASVFRQALTALLADLKRSGNPHIFVTSQILSPNPPLDELKQQACALDPAHRTFVDLSAYVRRKDVGGQWGHPNDAGMELIAETLLAAMLRTSSQVALTTEHLEAVNRRRRIYVNNDAGYDAVAMGPKPSDFSPDEWIAARFSVFTQPGCQVDCVGWCLDEGNIAAYPSRVIPELQYPTLLKWRSTGVDLAHRIIEESHRQGLEFFWEHRLNGADREADVTTPARHPLKEQHPDWLIPDGWWKPGLWNFAVPEVREFKLAVLREVAERYDLDGLNLDFGRHPPFLPVGQQWEQREALTEFVRRVRLMLQDIAERRGRPILLGVRVAETVPGCHFDGIDIDSWVRQNLVDLVIVGTRSMQVDLAGFRQITAGRTVKLYPCLDQHHSPDGYHALTAPEFLRGVAANWWQQGADGIATFNFWNETPEAGQRLGTSGPLRDGRSVHAQVYQEIGDSQTLGPLDKWFAVSRRYGGGFYDRQGNRWNDYLNLNHQAPLPLTLAADPAWVELSIADDLQVQGAQVDQIELRLQVTGDPDPQQLAIKFNGIRLAAPRVEQGWWSVPLKPVQLAVGRNLLTLDGGNPAGRKAPIVLEKAEMHITYRAAESTGRDPGATP